MQFHSRADWGADSPDYRNDIGDVQGCTIHWHGPGLGAYDHSECASIMRSMQDYHMDSNGWSDLGYSMVACRHGHVYEARGLGIQGAHAGESSIGGNERWYGIQAMVGQDDHLPDALFDGLRDAIDYCRAHGAGDRVNGHRDHHATTCPGDELYRWAHDTPMEDEDMPLTDEDVRRVARAVWHWDGIQTPDEWRDKDNPEWQAHLALSGAWQQATSAHEQAREDRTTFFPRQRALLREISRQVGAPVDIDEQALAQDILAGLREHLTVDQLAQTVREGLGDELAASLAERLRQ